MTSRFPLAVAVMLVAGFALHGTAAAAPATPAQIQSIISARAAELPNTGIVAAVVDNGRVTFYSAGSSGNARPLDRHTLFEIGSVTKTFTAAVLAEMVLDGEVRLSDPVQRYLPASVRVPARDGKIITLLNLATQHSGLPRLPSNLNPTNADPYASYTPADLYAFLNSYSLPRDPGASFEYSNLGVGLLGFALARASHTSYEAMVRERVWSPLHMDETRIVLGAADRSRLAQGYDADGLPERPWDFTEPMAGAGAIRSDITDMAKYLLAAMGHGPLAKAMLFAEKPRATLPGNHIGLVWWTNDETHSVTHDGDTAGYHAVVLMNAARTRGVVMLSNGPAVEDLAGYVLDTASPVQTPLPLPAVTLDEYVGTYASQTAPLTFVITRASDALEARIVGQQAGVIFASRPDHFYYNDVQAYIEFVRQNGRVVGLILSQFGRHVPCYRLDATGKPMTTISLEPDYPPVITLDAATLRSYAGTYSFLGEPMVVTVSGGQIFAKLGSQQPLPVYPSARDEFYYKVVDAQIHFTRDSQGNVTSLTLVQNGWSTPAARELSPAER